MANGKGHAMTKCPDCENAAWLTKLGDGPQEEQDAAKCFRCTRAQLAAALACVEAADGLAREVRLVGGDAMVAAHLDDYSKKRAALEAVK